VVAVATYGHATQARRGPRMGRPRREVGANGVMLQTATCMRRWDTYVLARFRHGNLTRDVDCVLSTKLVNLGAAPYVGQSCLIVGSLWSTVWTVIFILSTRREGSRTP
jgi:hypothetical protein